MKPVVLVTGGAQGIGRAYAMRFATEGYRVVIADTNIEKALEVAGAIQAGRGEATAVRADVSLEADCQVMTQHAVTTFGRIDVLINNAALKGLWNGRKKFWEIEVADWNRVMSVNVTGVWLAMRAVLPAMRAQGSGSIINMASSALLSGSADFLHYLASKGAVVAMTRSAARELGEFNIRVNCIMAGFIPTDSFHPNEDASQLEKRNQARSIKRPETAEDLVGAAVFLASADSEYMTGQALNIDGGQTHL